ncbi:MAG TPA: DNA replication/repair protein RecF [Acidimicrobiales bacterium]|nr:DNA replication/repair protein RecF [Acidimicrobiales bacterium]
MRVDRLWLTDFRSYGAAELAPAPAGLTVVVGPNGAGKTNLLEAVGWMATMSSFRAAPDDALVRDGAEHAVVRVEGVRDGRGVLVEAEIHRAGRNRVFVGRQPLKRSRDLLGALRVSVFSPDDLIMVKGGPGERRRWMDDTLIALHPRHDALRTDLDRVLRQRATLLKQAGGRLTADVGFTLDVWDAKLAELGEAWAAARLELVAAATPLLTASYAAVGGIGTSASMSYSPSWRLDSGHEQRGLAEALIAARPDDIRRGVSTVGPHRDDLVLTLETRPARTHASQGEQRSLALALRLAAHQIVGASAGSPPILLLDDVFSELDPARSEALFAALPIGQAILTTAIDIPAGAEPASILRITDGRITEVAA